MKLVICVTAYSTEFKNVWTILRLSHMTSLYSAYFQHRDAFIFTFIPVVFPVAAFTRVGTLIVATIYLQLIQNRYMFRSFTVLQCSHQRCCTTRCQRCGSRRMPLAASVVLIVRMERSTA